VNVGTRQIDRERGANVIDVGYDRGQIVDAVKKQIQHGPYPSEPIYGDGHAGKRIADILAVADFNINKRMTY